MRHAGGAFVGIDRLPVVVGHQRGLARHQPLDELTGLVRTDFALGCGGQVGQQGVDGGGGVLLSLPITPDGPRLIQPTTYSLRLPSIRPSVCGMVPDFRRTAGPAWPPRGSRRRGSPTARAVPRVCRCPWRPRVRPRRRPTRCCPAQSPPPSIRSVPLISTGDSEPEHDPALGVSRRRVGVAAHHLDVLLDDLARGFQVLVGDRVEVGRIDHHVHVAIDSRSASSRNSSVVNVACRGPRLPMITTSSTPWPCRDSSAWSAISVSLSSFGSATRIRATSSATLPLPTTTARVPARSGDDVLEVRVRVVPPDEVDGGDTSGQLLARDVRTAGRTALR